MRIATESLYDRKITAVHIEHAAGGKWTFAPFDDQPARMIEPLGDEHILALGDDDGIAIWNAVDRVRTVLTRTTRHPIYVPRAFAPNRVSLFLDERRGDQQASFLREIPLDGSSEQEHRIRSFSGRALGVVDGGDGIVITGSV